MALAWSDVPFPELSRDQLAAIIDCHDLHVQLSEVEQLPRVGVVNTALALGEQLVLRVPKPIPDCIRDTLTESVAAPVAHAAGVRTPELLIFDDARSILEVPYTVYERVHADNFFLVEHPLADTRDIYHELGRQLARLHQGVALCEDPNGFPDEPGLEDPQPLIERLTAKGLLSTRNERWLDRILRRLEPAVRMSSELQRFLHDDAHPGNMLVRDGQYAALIDWNDAGWGDPALEFVNIAESAVPHALAGYREVCRLDQDETAELRILWYHVVSALEYLEKPARADIPGYWPPTAPIIDLVHAVAAMPALAELLS